MFEAMRQHAQFSTRLSGVTATVLVAAAAAYVLLAGFGAPVPGGVRRPMAVITLTPPPPEEAPRPKFKDDALKDLQFGPEPRPQELPDIFEPDRQTAAEDSGLNVEPIGDGVVPPPHTPVNLAPRMKPMAPLSAAGNPSQRARNDNTRSLYRCARPGDLGQACPIKRPCPVRRGGADLGARCALCARFSRRCGATGMRTSCRLCLEARELAPLALQS